MIFVDASAFVSILAREPDAVSFAAEIVEAPRRLYSALSRWETITAFCRSHRFSTTDARSMVTDFLDTFTFELVVIGAIEAGIATDAYATHGKGRHPAALNMGDCFAYACAKSNGARLLYKGDDFARTDMAWMSSRGDMGRR